jgi:hypothetical protein
MKHLNLEFEMSEVAGEQALQDIDAFLEEAPVDTYVFLRKLKTKILDAQRRLEQYRQTQRDWEEFEKTVAERDEEEHGEPVKEKYR